MIADNDLDPSAELVELDCVLDQVEQDLLVDLPVCLDPCRDWGGLHDLDRQLPRDHLLHERLKEAAE